MIVEWTVKPFSGVVALLSHRDIRADLVLWPDCKDLDVSATSICCGRAERYCSPSALESCHNCGKTVFNFREAPTVTAMIESLVTDHLDPLSAAVRAADLHASLKRLHSYYASWTVEACGKSEWSADLVRSWIKEDL